MERIDEAGHEFPREAGAPLEQLCRLAASSDRRLALSGSEALFRGIVEPLADRFEPRLCDVYVETFAEVIDFCRRLPAGDALARKLSFFGLHGRHDLRRRASRVRKPSAYDLDRASRLRRIFVLSRVTLGADIAVTSVVLAQMKQFAPGAEILLVSGPKSASFFAADNRIGHLPIDYRREGTLFDRLQAWTALTEALDAEIDGLGRGEFLVVDPDSRLTQLGMLPLTRRDEGYCFLETRSYSATGNTASSLPAHASRVSSLPQWTALQMRSLFGGGPEPIRPYVDLALQDRRLGASLRAVCGPARLAAVNFGVGSNEAKRLDEPFERDLIGMLAGQGYRVVLDRGAGEGELSRMNALETALTERGLSLSRIHHDAVQPADVMTWEGSLSAFAGLLTVADLYIGYDSAAGHLAAALGTPLVSVFAGAPNRRMREMWSPWGRSVAKVVDVHPGEKSDSVLRRVEEFLP